MEGLAFLGKDLLNSFNEGNGIIEQHLVGILGGRETWAKH